MLGLTALPWGHRPGGASPSSGTRGPPLGGGKADGDLGAGPAGWAGAGAVALMGQAKGNQQRERGDRRGARPGALQGPCSQSSCSGSRFLTRQDGLTHPLVEMGLRQSGAEPGASGFCSSRVMGLSPHGQLGSGGSKRVRVAEEAVLIIYHRLWGYLLTVSERSARSQAYSAGLAANGFLKRTGPMSVGHLGPL